MTDRTNYSALQIFLHWAIAVLVLGSWITHENMGDALKNRIDSGTTGVDGATLHVWLGGAAFVLILVRLLVRAMQGTPGPAADTPPVMATAALWGHRLLYLLMVAAPALGALTWYGGVRAAGEAHELAGNALFFVALAHAGVALWHHFVKRDVTLRRMTRLGG